MDYKRNECEQLGKTEASYTDPVVTYREAQIMFREAEAKFKEASREFKEASTEYKCAMYLFIGTFVLILVNILLLYKYLKN